MEIPINPADGQFNGDVDHDYALTTGCPITHYRQLGNRSRTESAVQTGAQSKCRCLRNIIIRYRRELNALN